MIGLGSMDSSITMESQERVKGTLLYMVQVAEANGWKKNAGSDSNTCTFTTESGSIRPTPKGVDGGKKERKQDLCQRNCHRRRKRRRHLAQDRNRRQESPTGEYIGMRKLSLTENVVCGQELSDSAGQEVKSRARRQEEKDFPLSPGRL